MSSPKQLAALALGSRIRAICAIDALAQNNMEPAARKEIRYWCDWQMHQLGYESITERNERVSVLYFNELIPNAKDLRFLKRA